MRLLFIGDVVGRTGCEFIRRHIPAYRREHLVDLVIANGENSAEGNGILPHSASFLLDSGVDIITTGNHALRRREIYEAIDDPGVPLIRPINFHNDAPGKGSYLYDGVKRQVMVVNLQGTVYMDNLQNPFDAIDAFLSGVEQQIIVVDFHAEATAEKLCMGYYLDGRVSAVLGTHTHVQTADEQILPGGTGYITDVGMCGGYHSVLGVRSELPIKRLKTHLPVRFENETENCVLCGALLDIDDKTGKTVRIERVVIR